MSRFVSLSVARGTAESGMTFQDFDVPFVEGMSILDALMWIRANRDATLAIRFSCINANACKQCSVTVDGKVAYACTARLTPEGARVGPLENKRVVHDLVTDIVPPREHLSTLLDKDR